MDKVLAFSILSASPADVAPGARFSWQRQGRKLQDDGQARAGQDGKQGGLPAEAEQRQGRKLQDDGQARAGQDGKRGGLPAEAEQQPDEGKSQPPPTLRPRFAPEFDGIDCFGTIVCH